MALLGAWIKVVRAEVLIEGPVLEHVIDGRKYRCRDGQDRLLRATLRGQMHAQEIRWPLEGKRLMSRPISERIVCAAKDLTPGTVLTCSTAVRKGAMEASTSRSISAMAASMASI